MNNTPNYNDIQNNNNNEINSNTKYKSFKSLQKKEKENDNSSKKLGIVDTKLSELNNQIESMKNEHSKIVDTKKEFEKLLKKLKLDMEIYYKNRESDINEKCPISPNFFKKFNKIYIIFLFS